MCERNTLKDFLGMTSDFMTRAGLSFDLPISSFGADKYSLFVQSGNRRRAVASPHFSTLEMVNHIMSTAGDGLSTCWRI